MSTIICQIILSSFLWICFELGWCRVTAKLATDLLSSESYFGSLKSGCFGVRPKDERSSLGLLITKCICEARDLGLVRPLLMTKSTTKFEFEREHSQRTGNVAKIAGGLVLVKPVAEDY